MNALRSTLRQAAILLLVAFLPAVATVVTVRPAWRADTLREGEIALDTALRTEGALWIDARSDAAFALDHVPNALLLNEDRWNDLLPTVLQEWQPGQTAIVYCSSAGCEAGHEVAVRLRGFNLGPVYVLKGGWEAWKRK